MKATKFTSMGSQQLITAVMQAMSGIYAGSKKSFIENKTPSGRPFLWTSRPSEFSKGVDWPLDPT